MGIPGFLHIVKARNITIESIYWTEQHIPLAEKGNTSMQCLYVFLSFFSELIAQYVFHMLSLKNYIPFQT
jgi:hypothetical protein